MNKAEIVEAIGEAISEGIKEGYPVDIISEQVLNVIEDSKERYEAAWPLIIDDLSIDDGQC